MTKDDLSIRVTDAADKAISAFARDAAITISKHCPKECDFSLFQIIVAAMFSSLTINAAAVASGRDIDLCVRIFHFMLHGETERVHEVMHQARETLQ